MSRLHVEVATGLLLLTQCEAQSADEAEQHQSPDLLQALLHCS